MDITKDELIYLVGLQTVRMYKMEQSLVEAQKRADDIENKVKEVFEAKPEK